MKFLSDKIKTISLGLISIVFFISLTRSYAQNTTQETDKLIVVTSVSPITNILQNIGGDKIYLIGLVPDGVNSHTFEIVQSDAIKINNANLIVIPKNVLVTGYFFIYIFYNTK